MPIDVAVTLGVNLALLLTGFILVWLVSIRLGRVSIVDILWGPACALTAWTTLAQLPDPGPRAVLLTVLVNFWAARLALHLWLRAREGGEDPRYARLMKGAPTGPRRHLFTLAYVFGLQAVAAWIVAMPVQLGQLGGGDPGWLAGAGTALWAGGLLVETIADARLRRFQSQPGNRGRLLTDGLWAWSRHPNYLGEMGVWLGLFLIAAETRAGLASLVGPVLLLYALTRLSGKAPLEREMRERHPDYADYMRRTGGFLPRPPRRSRR